MTIGSLIPLYGIAAKTFGADFLQTTKTVDEDTTILAAHEPSTGSIISATACSVAIVPAWKYDNIASIHGMLNKAGHQEWVEIKEYWKGDCDRGAFLCPKRTGGCVCSVVFYRKTLLKHGHPGFVGTGGQAGAKERYNVQPHQRD